MRRVHQLVPGLRSRLLLLATGFLFSVACTSPSADAPPPPPEPAPASSVPVAAPDPGKPATEVDWAAVRKARREKRRERGDRLVTRFVGEFTGGGLPRKRVEIIPISHYDIRFILLARILERLEGDLPYGWERDDVVFGLHSPTLLFRFQGIPIPEDRNVPEGPHLLTLWQRPGVKTFELEVEPWGGSGADVTSGGAE